ncbi:DUF397 domain-containing protein [Streptomyces sp. SID11385]|nr:DUF397 domain-containing protein [Streptomyces sp. SID11385]
METAADRRTSSYDNGGTCIEVGTQRPHTAPVRDSKNPAGTHLRFLAPANVTAEVRRAVPRTPGSPTARGRGRPAWRGGGSGTSWPWRR